MLDFQVYPTYGLLSRAAADVVVSTLEAKPEAVICLPSGSTPLGMFRELVLRHEQGLVNFTRCTFVGLDEWIGMGPEEEGSCRQVMDQDLLHPIGFRAEQILFFNAKADDLPADCERINQALQQLGGLDLIVLGIGMNGHLALNEPGTPFDTYAHISELEPITKEVGQKYFKTPTILTGGVTIGLRHMREARQLVLLASGEAKAPAIARALRGEVTESFPASLVQEHPDALVLLDSEAASDLLQPGLS
ncbi:glucosamine-6-phosphate deaminase [Telluribacter sp.]|jgi:galactosamine-6-phosphate isomerase|uniref:glucosamine-6-phosphate deaminase n=1 Tax=Telluribacter sp. TaxID=1978767 RepID=UPI002E0D4341|nr:glucosamine-6-phosphate deaminase [Telluribacter sp.]